MTIEWLRDLVIIVFGLAATVAVLAIAVVFILSYLRVKQILESYQKIIETVKHISNRVEALTGPLAAATALFQGIRQAVKLVRRIKKTQEED